VGEWGAGVVSNLPEGQNAWEYTREQLDRLGIGEEIERIP